MPGCVQDLFRLSSTRDIVSEHLPSAEGTIHRPCAQEAQVGKGWGGWQESRGDSALQRGVLWVGRHPNSLGKSWKTLQGGGITAMLRLSLVSVQPFSLCHKERIREEELK